MTLLLVIMVFDNRRTEQALFFVCVFGLKLLNATKHKVLAVFYQFLRLLLMTVVVGCDQVRHTHIVLREIRFV